MDALCLYAAGALLGTVPTVRRLAFGAATGGLVSCLMLFFPERWYTILLTIFLSFLLFYITYPRNGLPGAIMGGILFFAVSALISGIFSVAVRLVTGGQGSDRKGKVVLLLALSTACAILTVRAIRSRSADQIVDVEITIRGAKLAFSAIVDTGNLLREPISGLPVAVMSRALSERTKRLLGENAPMRYIPATTVCGSKPLMAFRPAEAILLQGKRKTPVSIYFALSDCPDFGTAQCLLPAGAARKEFLCSVNSSKN